MVPVWMHAAHFQLIFRYGHTPSWKPYRHVCAWKYSNIVLPDYSRQDLPALWATSSSRVRSNEFLLSNFLRKIRARVVYAMNYSYGMKGIAKRGCYFFIPEKNYYIKVSSQLLSVFPRFWFSILRINVINSFYIDILYTHLLPISDFGTYICFFSFIFDERIYVFFRDFQKFAPQLKTLFSLFPFLYIQKIYDFKFTVWIYKSI